MKIFCALSAAAFTSLTLLPAACAPPTYTIADRGKLPTCSDDIAPSLDSDGNVSAWTSVGDSTAQATLSQASGATQTLGGLPGYPVTYATDVSGNLVSGVARTPSDLRPSRAFVWQAGRLRDLGTLGGKYSAAHAVNPRGQVAGSAQTLIGDTHAALWPAIPGPARDLGTLGTGNYSTANSINPLGDVVGASNLVPNGKVHGFLWHAGRMRDLGALPFGALSNARAVNARGDVAGWGELPGGELHAVWWQGGGHCADLGTLGDDPSAAWGINDRDQIVGTSAIKAGRMHAFLWQDGVMTDLNTLLPAKSGWILTAAYRINSRGQIVGRGFYRGEMHTALLTPTGLTMKKAKP